MVLTEPQLNLSRKKKKSLRRSLSFFIIFVLHRLPGLTAHPHSWSSDSEVEMLSWHISTLTPQQVASWELTIFVSSGGILLLSQYCVAGCCLLGRPPSLSEYCWYVGWSLLTYRVEEVRAEWKNLRKNALMEVKGILLQLNAHWGTGEAKRGDPTVQSLFADLIRLEVFYLLTDHSLIFWCWFSWLVFSRHLRSQTLFI